MAKEQLVALSDLKSRFSEFAKIADITADLKSTLEQINTANATAAGTDDEIAKTYHEKIKEPTEGLVDLVDGIAKMLDLTGDNGATVADGFTTADDAATTQGQSW